MMNSKFILLFVFLITIFYSCQKLEVENNNNPDVKRVLASGADVLSILKGGFNNFFLFSIGNSPFMQLNCLADQTTSTNNIRSFWAFSDQPRRRMDNSPTFSDAGSILEAPWVALNAGITTSNTILVQISNGLELSNSEGDTITEDVKALAYLLRGLSRGYIGVIFDKALIVNQDYNKSSAITLSGYSDVINSAISDIDNAISIISSSSTFSSSSIIIPGEKVNATRLVQIANSYAARILIALSRSVAESESLGVDHYNKILGYLSNPIKTDINPTSTETFFNNGISWGAYILSDGAGYLPRDCKIFHLVDPVNFPKDYVYSEVGPMSPAVTSDHRIDSFFGYDSSYGYLNASRNDKLFSNYSHKRYADNYQANNAGNGTYMMMLQEIKILEAEAYYWLKNYQKAAEIINSSNRILVGKLPPITDFSKAKLEYVLFYESAVELDLVAGAHNFAFMRRHDLLQNGTPKHLPIPGSQLEVMGQEIYTFGGEGNTDKGGTSSGDGWKGKDFSSLHDN